MLLVAALYGAYYYFNQQQLPQPQAPQETGCPPEGDAKSIKVQQLNTLKNRTQIVDEASIDHAVTLAKILEPGDDSQRFNTNQAVEITGYVAEVKSGGPETCNCKADDEDDEDTHIELVENAMHFTRNQKVIIEVTPRMRKLMAAKGIDWSTETLRYKYLGRRVKVQGWLLFDFEHERSAENTNPGNPRNWRATSWEVHPITSIEVTTRQEQAAGNASYQNFAQQ